MSSGLSASVSVFVSGPVALALFPFRLVFPVYLLSVSLVLGGCRRRLSVLSCLCPEKPSGFLQAGLAAAGFQ